MIDSFPCLVVCACMGLCMHTTKYTLQNVGEMRAPKYEEGSVDVFVDVLVDVCTMREIIDADTSLMT